MGILEEAEQIPFDVITNGILPCMTRLHARLAVITTPTTEDSYISLMFKKDAISDKYFIQSVEELWCAACKQAGRSARECLQAGHESDKLPRHKPRRNMEISLKLMVSDQAVETELAGSALTGTKAFEMADVEHLGDEKANPPVNCRDAAFDVVYSFADPSGGGSGSTLVISSWGRLSNGTWVWLGLSSQRTGFDEAVEFAVEEHFRKLRALKCCAKSLFVIFVENNYGGGPTAGEIMSIAERAAGGNVHRCNERWDMEGMTTTAKVKRSGVRIVRQLLDRKNPKLRFAKDMVSNKPEELDKLKREALDQLRRYRRILKYKADGRVEEHFTGKNAAADERDDITISITVGMHWTQTYAEVRPYEHRMAAVLMNAAAAA